MDLNKMSKADAMEHAQHLAEVTELLRSTAGLLVTGHATPEQDQQQATVRDRLAVITNLGPMRTQAVLLLMAGVIVNTCDADRIRAYVELQIAAVNTVMEEGL